MSRKSRTPQGGPRHRPQVKHQATAGQLYRDGEALPDLRTFPAPRLYRLMPAMALKVSCSCLSQHLYGATVIGGAVLQGSRDAGVNIWVD